jgi:hypothetical protein
METLWVGVARDQQSLHMSMEAFLKVEMIFLTSLKRGAQLWHMEELVRILS